LKTVSFAYLINGSTNHHKIWQGGNAYSASNVTMPAWILHFLSNTSSSAMAEGSTHHVS